MEKITFNLTNSEIESIVSNVFDSEKFWIEEIKRLHPKDLQGTIVVVKPYDEADETKVKIQFLHDRLEVEGCDVSIIRKLYKAYYKMVADKIPEYKKEYEESLSEIDDFINEYKEQIKNHLQDYIFEEAGFLSYQAVKDKISAYKMSGKAPETIKLGGHVEYARTKSNKYDKENRVIHIGGIYVVDFNPVVDTEYGGIRPAVIIGNLNDQNYFCVPLSHQDSQGIPVGQVKEKDAYAVVSQLKIVSPARIFQDYGMIDEEKYEEIVSNVQSGVKIFPNIKENAQTEGLKTVSGGGISPAGELAFAIDKREFFENASNDMPRIHTAPLVNSKLFKAYSQDTLHLEIIEKELVYPTEEEYIEILNKKLNHLKKTKNLRFINAGKGKNQIAYEFSRVGNSVVITVNKGHSDHKNGYYEMRYEFNSGGVRCESELYQSRKVNDTFMKLEYFKLMLEKNEKYHLILFRNYVRSFNGIYIKYTQHEADEDVCANILDEQINSLQENLGKLGIAYDGDFEALVLSGERAIDYSLISREEPENENEQE